MDERRRSRRVAPAEEICILIGGNRPAQLVDISPEGAHLELGSALSPNEHYRVALELSAQTVRIKARVVHCKLVGYTSFGSGGQLVYRAGVEFIDVDSLLAESIRRTFPIPRGSKRRGPIRIRVDVEALERAAEREDD